MRTDTGNSGRISDYEELASLPAVQQRLQQLYLLTIGSSSEYMSKARRTGSLALTLERFADDDLCPEHLKEPLRRGKQPEPLKRIIRAINAELWSQSVLASAHQALAWTVGEEAAPSQDWQSLVSK